MPTADPEGHKVTEHIEFEIHWTSYSNDDMPEDEGFPENDEGWYVDATLPDGTGFDLGPDHFGPGLTSIDHALVLIESWAKGRGMNVDREFGVQIKVTVR
jgi:hypothetical protein